VDAHVHYWDSEESDLSWPWLAAVGIDSPRYGPAEHRAEIDGSDVVGVVHVQSAVGDAVGETRWLEAVADDHGWPSAIVGDCDLASAGAADVLRAQAGSSRFRGVRDMRTTARLVVEEVAPALAVAGELRLTVELRVDVSRFDVLVELGDRFGDVTFVLANAGLPMDPSSVDPAAWQAAMTMLGAVPTWTCKLSGLATRAGASWSAARITPWIDGAVAAFGADRCMFGTNWPLDRLVAPFDEIVATYDDATAGRTEGERASLFHHTANTVYRIDQ
jgi:predicted TIM-barrel fold metal-dependent hydrolase